MYYGKCWQEKSDFFLPTNIYITLRMRMKQPDNVVISMKIRIFQYLERIIYNYVVCQFPILNVISS